MRLKLWDWGPGSILDEAEFRRYLAWVEAGGSDPEPDIRPLVTAALRLPREVVAQIPCVESLAELAPLSESTDRGLFLAKFLDRHPELCRRPRFGGKVDHAIASAMADALHAAIRVGLARVDASLKTALPLSGELKLNF